MCCRVVGIALLGLPKMHNDKSSSTAATSRVLPFPIQKVWSAFSNPASLAKWWGPSGFTNTFERFEFKTGGEWQFVMHGPDGTNYPNTNVFQTIDEPRKMVIRHVVQPLFTLTVVLAEKANETELTWTQAFDNSDTYAAIRHIIEPANEQNLDRLSAVLAAA